MDATTEDQEATQAQSRGVPMLCVLFSGEQVADLMLLLSEHTPLVIGRGAREAAAAPWSADRSMSRQHARIVVAPQGDEDVPAVFLHDMDSSQGTFVNGQRVRSAQLCDGDVIRLGRTLLLFRYELARHLDAEVPLLLGEARALRLLRSRLVLAARGSAPILVLGEVGAGKEVTARAVHQASGRTGPFLAFNCAALSESLAESELFGYAPHSFSGADKNGRRGFFQEAHRGTLLLDEVGELSLSMQAKLLRVLAEQSVVRVGGRQAEPVDVRIVAATNRDLALMVEAGAFRADLYSRLRGAVLIVPPLRERREDILPLFLRGLCPAGSPTAPRLTARLCEALLLYGWPYNVRELLQLATTLRPLLGTSDELDLPQVLEWHPLSALSASAPPPTARLDRSLGVLSPAAPCAPELDPDSEAGPRRNAEVLRRLLHEKQGNLSEISRLLGRSRRQILRWMANHGIARATVEGARDQEGAD